MPSIKQKTLFLIKKHTLNCFLKIRNIKIWHKIGIMPSHKYEPDL